MKINIELSNKITKLLQGFGFINITYSDNPKNSFITENNDRIKPNVTSNNNMNRIRYLKTIYEWKPNPTGGKRHTKKHRVKRRKTHKKY
jgi:hypothetical protein